MKCPDCQLTVPDDSNFCSKCGFQFVEPTGEEKSCIASDCERKHVTIMFSDLSGYTAMTEKLDPEEVKEIMNQIFGKVTKIIQGYDGFIERFIGDADIGKAKSKVPGIFVENPLGISPGKHMDVRALLRIFSTEHDMTVNSEGFTGSFHSI